MDRNGGEKEEEERTESACRGNETPADRIVWHAEITGSASLKNIPAGNRLEERERRGESRRRKHFLSPKERF